MVTPTSNIDHVDLKHSSDSDTHLIPTGRFTTSRSALEALSGWSTRCSGVCGRFSSRKRWRKQSARNGLAQAGWSSGLRRLLDEGVEARSTLHSHSYDRLGCRWRDQPLCGPTRHRPHDSLAGGGKSRCRQGVGAPEGVEGSCSGCSDGGNGCGTGSADATAGTRRPGLAAGWERRGAHGWGLCRCSRGGTACVGAHAWVAPA